MTVEATTFRAGITPPVGHPLCAGWYPSATAIGAPLQALGLVLRPPVEAPIVLCALDWAEVSNLEHLRWRAALAAAAGTSPDRVTVHCTHVHDAPWPDREAQDLLDARGHPDVIMSGDACAQARAATASALAAAMASRQPCTHIRTGAARVHEIASNRRILGADGTVKGVRYTQCRSPALRAEPEGLIDPDLKTISFWNGDTPIAALHYYAVHPTAIDRTGVVTPEFVGLARNRCAEENGFPHLYFTGCAGNITPGKYNDGDAASRERFTSEITSAIRRAEQHAQTEPLARLRWTSIPVMLPPRPDLTEQELLATLRGAEQRPGLLSRAALAATYLQRQATPMEVGGLHLNENTHILHLPGEAFIEYQLHAQQQRPSAFVATAAYGDLGPGYICMDASFAQGGYEPTDAFCGPGSEPILKRAITSTLS